MIFPNDYLNKIICGDCLEIMKGIPDKSVDLVLTDPPYGTTVCEWDTVLRLELFWPEFERVTKSCGTKILMATQPFTTDLIDSNRMQFKYELIWDKGRGREPQLCNIRPMKAHENIVVFANGKTKYNPQKVKLLNPDIRETNTISGGEQKIIKNYGKRDYKKYEDRFPTSVLSINTENGLHPTQKPVALFEYLIKTYSDDGDLILDPFFGSGTTGVAAKLLGRQYIGIEISERYCEIARKRIDATLVNKKLNFKEAT